ncbi:hypothetical protein CI102_15103 [Trichoderma harzianum]|uniref:CHAT domain-containing protein n=1 Tax=Trichoderma harzianum CBS 226.95 TaxID=983964 RepID=A0A2T4A4R7_TRIHA|nr:hypothetical protein M431DRAFT_92242 [Trichoderma harzianum CBS 226.95]PKK41188.1 hypothetical protein CI102_15103 [Trichoderma harzianum]PTB51963.1 hypothetical protein M431DRAFT_92242 [Trichoderma harzianum CBS 226.95]
MASTLQKELKEIPNDSGDRSNILHKLGVVLRDRSRLTGSFEDFKTATSYFQEAVESMPVSHPDRKRRLCNLAMQRFDIYYKTTIPTTEEEVAAISALQAAVDATLPQDPDRAVMLNNLGLVLLQRGRASDSPHDLRKAVQKLQEAVDATPANHHDHDERSELLDMLGNLLLDEYKKTRTIDDLDGAIKGFRDAVEATPMAHSDRPRRLSNLGVWLSEKYSLTSKPKDLEEAIILSQQAVDTTPLQSSLRAEVLSNLGIRLSERYRQAGHQDDLNEAIRHLRDATSTCTPPSKDLDRAGLYTNLGLLLYHKYNTTQEMDHLDQAIDCCQKAVDVTPDGAKVRAKVLTHLGIMLGARYKRTEVPQDLEDAISRSLQAVEEKSDHPDTAACLNNLALHLGTKYDKTRNFGILEETIRYHKKAMEGTPQDHSDYAIWANNLGMRLAELYERTQSEEDLESAVSNLTEAVTMNAGLPIERIMAARSLGAAMIDKSRWVEALDTYNIAFQVLQTLHLRALPRTDQQWILGNLSGLSSNAASCILQVKRPASEALQFLEASRCVIAGFAINSRTDVTELRAKDQDLCNKYESCRDVISRWERYQEAIPDGLNKMNSQDSVSLPEKLKELGDIEKRIRQIPGLQRFQLPLSSQEMMDLAKRGPIITLNVSKIRSDAIIVTSTDIWPIHLPGLHQDRVDKISAVFLGARPRSFRDTAVMSTGDTTWISEKERLQEDLLWLWKCCVCPVLDEVDDLKPKRVWWSAGGSAGRLPFHAAGDHSRNSNSNTISRVVSSYTSTLKALKYSMEMPGSKASTGRMLLIDMPETPGYDDLNTTHEVAVITSQFGHRVTHLKSCSKSDVIANLSNSKFVHFACHGTSDPHDPSESGLVLLEEDAPALLTIGELDRINMQNAEIAYLSACSTAELSVGELLDEAIHISNSFQMLGFKHVVGTMWSADDHAAGVVARQFYTQLLGGDEEDQDEHQVAQVLHRAVCNFRKKAGVREDILLWGSFIHIGA